MGNKSFLLSSSWLAIQHAYCQTIQRVNYDMTNDLPYFADPSIYCLWLASVCVCVLGNMAADASGCAVSHILLMFLGGVMLTLCC